MSGPTCKESVHLMLEYLEREAGVSIRAIFADRIVSLAEEGIDQALFLLEEALLREGVLDPARLISGRAALRVSSSEDSYGDPLSVAELGERVGADVVIYVSMQRWTLSRDGGTLSPSVAGEVKVIDAKSKARLWPPSRSSGYTLVVEPETKVNNADIPREIAQRSQTEIATARQFGLALAQMFYKHETRQSARQ